MKKVEIILSKFNKQQQIILLLFIVGFLSFIGGGLLQIQSNDIDYEKIVNFKSYQDGKIESTSGYIVDNEEYTAINSDPQLNIEITEQSVSTILLKFSEYLQPGIDIQIFYSVDGEEISEENSLTLIVMEETKWIEINIPKAQYNSFRIDIGSETGVSFDLDEIYCFNNRITRFDEEISKISIYNSIAIISILFVLQLVILACCYYINISIRKNWWGIVVVAIVSMVIAILLQFQVCEIQYEKIVNSEKISEMTIVETQGYTVDGGVYQSNNSDSQLYLDTSERLVATLLLHFNELPQEETEIQIFYIKAGSEASEEESEFIAIDIDNNWIKVEVAKEQYEFIRLDIGNEENFIFSVDEIYSSGTTITTLDEYMSKISLVNSVFITLLVFAVILIFIILLAYISSMMKGQVIAGIAIFSVILAVLFQLQVNSINYDEIINNQGYIEGTVEGSNDYMVKGNEYISVGSDPQLYIDISESSTSTVLLHFSEALPQGISIQVFYAKNGEKYSEEKSEYITIESEEWLEIEVDKGNYDTVRLDIGNEEGMEFILEGIYCLDDEISSSEKNISKLNLTNSLLVATLILAGTILIVASCIFFAKLMKKYNVFYKIKQNMEKHPFCFLTILIVGISAIVYWEFIINDRYFLLVSDALTQFIIEQMTLLEQISEGVFPMWSFEKGFGAQITVGNPNWLGDPFAVAGILVSVIVGEETLPYVIGVISVLKVILSTYLFALYLREFDIKTKNNYEILIIFSVLYAFNGHAIMRGAWIHYMTEVTLVALWLLGLEKYLKNKTKLLFPISLAVLFVSRNVAYVYVYSVLTFLYLILRTLAQGKYDLKKIILCIAKMIPYYILGLLISAIMVLPGLYQMFESARVDVDNINILANCFKINSAQDMALAFARSFSPGINPLGLTHGYEGINYLENPIPYCGILCMLLIPQIWGFKKGNERLNNFFKGLIILVVLYYVFKCPRLILTAFSSSAYKISSFWTNITLLGTSAFIFREIRSGRQKLHKGLLNMSVMIYGMVFILIYVTEIIPIVPVSMVLIIVFSGCYTIYFNYIDRIQQGGIFLIIIVSIEVILMSCQIYSSLEYEDVESTDYYINGNGELEGIYMEEESLSRVTKSTITIANEPQIENYYGTSVYTSVDSEYMLDFYEYFEIERALYFVLDGIYGYERLESLTSVRYCISEEERDGYEFIMALDEEWSVYENENYLPLGFMYNEVVLNTSIEDYSSEFKQQIALEAIILLEEEYNEVSVLTNISEYELVEYGDLEEEYQQAVEERNQETMVINSFDDNYIEGYIDIEESGLLFLSIPYDKGWKAIVNGTECDVIRANIGFSAIMLENGENDIVLSYETPYLKLGVIISGISITIWLGLVSITMYKKRKEKEE